MKTKYLVLSVMLAAVEAGADAIGMVFYEPSPRAVTVDQAVAICQAIPAFVSVVALTVDAEPALIKDITTRLPIDLLQFHGKEPVVYLLGCAWFSSCSVFPRHQHFARTY